MSRMTQRWQAQTEVWERRHPAVRPSEPVELECSTGDGWDALRQRRPAGGFELRRVSWAGDQLAVQRAFRHAAVPTRPSVEARCRVVEFGDVEAVCAVILDGYELPRVGLPAAVLRAHNLDVGSWFVWQMRGEPTLVDIEPEAEPLNELTAAERAELDRLERWYNADPTARRTFTEYTGNSR